MKKPEPKVFTGFLLDYVEDDREFGFWNPRTKERIVIKGRRSR